MSDAPAPAISRSEHAYRQLRDLLVNGDYRPNERLVETELAERLHISRTPIRDALQRLVDQGMIESRNRGWIVREHTAREIREIFEARAALEGFATRLAAERATDEELKRISFILERDRPVLTLATENAVQHNDEFHAVIVGACRNDRIIDLIRRNHDFYFNYRVAHLYTPDETTQSFIGHEQMAKHLIARDGPRAEIVARQHILESIDLILSKLH